ncbi:hypothetical protein K3X48_11260 [Aliiroseovarius crassostreae]|uniref:Uncharacterized protein n=1 Tax=Aliiroseovarius crassostreae TaxID=154981 RepID=A0A9Q9H8D5_9RHOB|nr:hypothetical protein [Aliiroseovarius crassostreae]UWP94783.1 hypothetical protein K3X48_11260 [Aliiroseovarius crassostreae]
MGDVLKDLMDAANNRIRSPFLGSILFVFLVVNWRPLFNLLFGETEVLVRLAHFDNATTWVTLYLVPIVGGIFFAILSPWLNLVGAWVAKRPLALHRDLQHSEEVARQVFAFEQSAKLEEAKAKLIEAKAKREEEEQNRQIEAAERLKRAAETGDEELEEVLRTQNENRNADTQQAIVGLSKLERLVIDFLGEINLDNPKVKDFLDNSLVKDRAKEFILNYSKRRLDVEGVAALEKLVGKKLVTWDRVDGTIGLTARGYEVFDDVRYEPWD